MQGRGDNGTFCGARSNPCNDLGLVVQKISKNNDIILLLQNGEEGNSMRHKINETIKINQDNLTIKAVTGDYAFTPLDSNQHDTIR